MGQNPTSGVLSLPRRREIYALCSKYDIIIVEDDPYWYLQYPSATSTTVPFKAPHSQWKSSGYEFLDSLVPSFLQIDVDGRVVRLDTFSKTVAPGCRLGWITAQPALVERILRITETSTQQPSGFVQSMIAELLLGPSPNDDGKGGRKDGEDKGWEVDGWVRWLEGLRGNYERRMNHMCSILHDGRELVKSGRRGSLNEALASVSLSPSASNGDEEDDDDEWAVVEKTALYDFTWPVGGMFVWLKMNFASHPLFSKVPGARLSRAMWIFWTTKPYLVLVSPGQIFSPTDDIRDNEGWKYFRMCFAACDEEQLGPITQRLTDAVQAFFRIKSVGKIDELLDEDEQALETRLARQGDAMGCLAGFGNC